MLISDILSTHPEAASVFERYGLHCCACLAAGMESLSAVATVHDVSLEDIISDLNELTEVSRVSDEGGVTA